MSEEVEPIRAVSASIGDKALYRNAVHDGFRDETCWEVMYPLNYWHPVCVEDRGRRRDAV